MVGTKLKEKRQSLEQDREPSIIIHITIHTYKPAFQRARFEEKKHNFWLQTVFCEHCLDVYTVSVYVGVVY